MMLTNDILEELGFEKIEGKWGINYKDPLGNMILISRKNELVKINIENMDIARMKKITVGINLAINYLLKK